MTKHHGIRMAKRVGLLSTVLLATAGLLACSATDTQMERWASKFTQPAIEVTALDLFKEYTRDSETAQLKYDGRRVLLSGTVEEVNEDDDFEPRVEFDVCPDDYCFDGIVGQFAERHRDVVYSWKAGEDITVLCYIPVDDFSITDWDSKVPLRMCQPVR